MFSTLKGWIARRRKIRRRWQANARLLILKDERSAYYAVHRLAAPSRTQGNMSEFMHWAKVAASRSRAT
jgi:hypothetical protein